MFSGLYAILLLLCLPWTYAEDYENMLTSEIVNKSDFPSFDLYLHAPSLLKTDSSLLAVYGWGKNGESARYGAVRRSTDGGVTWQHRIDIPDFNAGSFFAIGSRVYLLYEDNRTDRCTKIRQSENDGLDWSTPVVLYPKPFWDGNGAWALHDGHLYKALDELQDARPPFAMPRVLKLDVTKDPMEPANWIFSAYPNFDYPPPAEVRDYQNDNGQVDRNNSEGNCVVGPDGKLWVIYRHFERSRGIFNATVFFDATTNTQSFRNVYDPHPAPGEENCYSDFPGACSGFHIKRDPVSGKYIALANPVTGETEYPDGASLGIYRLMRNVLVMLESDDLKHWRTAKHLVKDDVERTWEDSVKRSGFQQINFEFDGNDLIWISRTAYDGAENLHDANRITFHRLPDFRQYLGSDDEIACYSFDDPAHPGADTCKQAGPGVNGGNRAAATDVGVVEGRIGGAGRFNGATSRMDVNYHIGTELHRAPAVTIAAWVYIDALPAADNAAWIFKSAIHGNSDAVCLGFYGSHIQIGSRSCRQDAFSTLDYPFAATGRWVHVTGVYDFGAKAQELYLDGQRVASKPAAYTSQVLLRGIPLGKDSIGDGFAGRMDELHIYRKRLSSGEIQALMDHAK